MQKDRPIQCTQNRPRAYLKHVLTYRHLLFSFTQSSYLFFIPSPVFGNFIRSVFENVCFYNVPWRAFLSLSLSYHRITICQPFGTLFFKSIFSRFIRLFFFACFSSLVFFACFYYLLQLAYFSSGSTRTSLCSTAVEKTISVFVLPNSCS